MKITSCKFGVSLFDLKVESQLSQQQCFYDLLCDYKQLHYTYSFSRSRQGQFSGENKVIYSGKDEYRGLKGHSHERALKLAVHR